MEAKKSINVFVTRLAIETTENDLLEYTTGMISDSCNCTADDLSVKCTKLPTKYDTYSSYHIQIRLSASSFSTAIECMMLGDNWPEGVLVRRYFVPRNVTSSTDLRNGGIKPSNC